MEEKVLFLGQIFEKKIFMDLHAMRSPESENHIFNVWSVCVFVISITQKQIIAETKFIYILFKLNLFIFYLCIQYMYSLKLFMKVGQIVRLQGHAKDF